MRFTPSLFGAVLAASLLIGSSTTALSQSKGSKSKKPAKTSAAPAKWDPSKVNRSFAVGMRAATKALSFRGVPYHFGGQSRKGIDCSALIQTAYKQWGILLPRTSVEQYKTGVNVPKAQMKPGDLVFFKNTYKRGVSHVGIYMGNNQFVHASSGRGQVTVSTLSDPYYVNHWAGARRVARGKETCYAKAEVVPAPAPQSHTAESPAIGVTLTEAASTGPAETISVDVPVADH